MLIMDTKKQSIVALIARLKISKKKQTIKLLAYNLTLPLSVSDIVRRFVFCGPSPQGFLLMQWNLCSQPFDAPSHSYKLRH